MLSLLCTLSASFGVHERLCCSGKSGSIKHPRLYKEQDHWAINYIDRFRLLLLKLLNPIAGPFGFFVAKMALFNQELYKTAFIIVWRHKKPPFPLWNCAMSHEANWRCALPNCSTKGESSRQVPKSDWNKAGKKHKQGSTAAALLLIMLLPNTT